MTMASSRNVIPTTFKGISYSHGRLHPQLARTDALFPCHSFGCNQNGNQENCYIILRFFFIFDIFGRANYQSFCAHMHRLYIYTIRPYNHASTYTAVTGAPVVGRVACTSGDRDSNLPTGTNADWKDSRTKSQM